MLPQNIKVKGIVQLEESVTSMAQLHKKGWAFLYRLFESTWYLFLKSHPVWSPRATHFPMVQPVI